MALLYNTCMSKIEQVYRTNDGEVHDTEVEAKRHQLILDLDSFCREHFGYNGGGGTHLDSEVLVETLLGKRASLANSLDEFRREWEALQ